MSHPHSLPPFDVPSVEKVVQEQLDHHQSIRLSLKQQRQLADRQGFLNARVDSLATDVGRIADAQTHYTGMLELVLLRLKKVMDFHKLTDE